MVIQEIVYLLISFIIFYFLYRAYEFLTHLESCDCAPASVVKNLESIEIIYLVIILMGIVFKILFLLADIDLIKVLEKNMSPIISVLVVSYIFAMFAIFVWYIYNILEYNNALKDSCQCTNAWQNNIFYVHALYMAAPILMAIIGALNDFKVNTSLFVLVVLFVFIVYLYENYVIQIGKKTQENMTDMQTNMLKEYEKAMGVFNPAVYNSRSEFDAAATAVAATRRYLPQVAQPNQSYRQRHPSEYPTDPSVRINAPISSHENIVRKMRSGDLRV